MKIGITGAGGLLGWHLRVFLRVHGAHEARLATRETFERPELLQAFTSELDALVHLAGMNRGDDAEVERTNVELARGLVHALRISGAKPRLVFANSNHVDRDTGYGRGKRQAAAVLGDWAAGAGTPFADLVFPHVFGEHGKPFYNSVVSTFCHQLAAGETPRVLIDGDLELLHAQGAARHCVEAAEASHTGRLRLRGRPMKVTALLERLRGLFGSYVKQLMPELPDDIDRDLFNTLRSYLFPGHYPVELQLHSDARGALFEAVRTRHAGQTFVSSTWPGVTRGNHFHTRKVERFLVLAGEAQIRLRRLFDTHITNYTVSGSRPCYIDIPTFHAHSITNSSRNELVTLFWSNEIFDSSDPDTYPERVSPDE